MHIQSFIELYSTDSLIHTLANQVKNDPGGFIQLKGLVGSLDAVIASSLYQIHAQHHVFVVRDKEEAAYFYNDLQNLNQNLEILLFPSSYKKPYQLEETENANVLMRAEILNRINNPLAKGELIVTYPDALAEKVINKKSLLQNTFAVKAGDKLDTQFLSELLISYDFEKTDFVYEAGQFAIRGGIVDIFSYAHEMPYRLELFGNEVESIRIFDVENQLSQEKVERLSIIPNIQTKLLQEERQSFVDFLPKENTKLWFKDFEQTKDVIASFFVNAEDNFNKIISASGNTQVISRPEILFETQESFSGSIEKYTKIEFGNRFYSSTDKVFQFESEPQPSFNKNFEILVENLRKLHEQSLQVFISSDSEHQIERLTTIFEELDSSVVFEPLYVSLRQGFIDKTLKHSCYTDHQLFDRFHRYKTRTSHAKSRALTLKELRSLNTGDYVVHIDHGIGRFAGLEKVDVGGREQEAVRLVYRDNDLLYVSIHSLHKISKYSGQESVPPAISKLGSPDWDNKKKKAKKKVKDIAKDLIDLYAKRKASPGYAFKKDDFLQAELESSFMYEDTPDQAKATEDVKSDMLQPYPMDRLVCGDVGFGKTEVAIRAAFKAINDGKQVAVLVPTTILAMQHYQTFTDRLSNFPITVEYINRFKSNKNIKEILNRVKEGKVDILIGTHRIVNKDVVFKDLGLMVIDEEQKFGVKVKERLKEMRVNVDALTLTATPIPRTLHFSLMGARDLSIISTPPLNRQPVTTEIHTFNEVLIRDAVSFELKRGGQVFFVHNRVQNIEEVADIILRLVPDSRVAVAHGQMDGARLEKTMLRFIEGEYDVLVCTNIIESGLDISNANTIIINNAHMFGLSDLHQMRGRVGRSNRKAFCYLLAPPTIGLTADARKRLSTLEEFSELGDGFKVAMRDLDIRGAGNLLGAEQSGFISDLGFDMYHKILDETVQELKETDFKDLFSRELSEYIKPLVQDCSIETDLEILIPEEYVSSTTERLSLYSKLDNLKNENELKSFQLMLEDRFGPIPEQVQELVSTVRLRWIAETLGFEKLTLKNASMKGYFASSDNQEYFNSEIFGKILQYVQQHPKSCRLKETKKRLILVIQNIENTYKAIQVLESML
ncbi:transcription-repair coupling factor [Catalinimonas niigatensis]|uniref:transcription-repair coupling factor n=1 Tax=Catalinimonas niigatensis TaxID=1397264 RepID=UPI002664F8A1|nr:transcription-repair coupling factor [Catalinimonas niigatensis]WPP48117.1 transcription-repair coupling factor [Catalinimonas niigatensis]